MTEKYGWDQTPTPDLGLDITKAPADIQKLYKWVIQKTYGQDVASAYAQGLVAAGIIAKNAEAMSLFTSGRMDELNTYVDNMLLEMTDKDVISAPEIIQMRDGEATANDRLIRDFNNINGQLLQNTLKTSRILVVDSFLSVEDSDDSSAIQAAIDAANDGDTVMFLPRTYHANFARIESKNDIVLDGNACSIIYNGEYTMADEKKARLFIVTNSKRITIKNMKLYGKMFDGLNKESMPTNPIEDNIFTTLFHTAIISTYSEDVKVDNVTFEDFCQSLEIAYVDGFELKDLKSKDTRTGYRMYKSSRGRVINVDSQDARYTLDYIASGTDEPLVTSIGAAGSGMLIDACADIIVEKSSVQRAGTNSFRIQGRSKSIVLRDCWTYQARRHGFSVYGEDNNVIFENCEDKNTSDPDFWNGKDYSNTFKRPHEEDKPVGIVVSNTISQLANNVEILNCKVTAIQREVAPVSNNPDGVFRAVAPRRLILISENNIVKIKGLKLSGYSTSYPADISCYNSYISDLDIEGNMLPVETGKYNLRAETTGTTFKNISSKNGMGPIFHGEKNVIKDIYSTGSNYHGINIQSDDSYVDGCIVTNSNERGSDGFGIYVVGAKGVVFGTNIVRDTRPSPKIYRAYGLSANVEDFEPGRMIAQGVEVPIYNGAGVNKFVTPMYGKAAATIASTASDVVGVRNDLNTVIQRLKNANLMSQ